MTLPFERSKVRRGKRYSASADQLYSTWSQLVENHILRHGLTTEASAASVTGKSEYQTNDERCTDMLIAISDESKISSSTDRKREQQWSLTSEMYLQCSEESAAVAVDINTKSMMSAT